MFERIFQLLMKWAALNAFKRQGRLVYLKVLNSLRKGLRLALLLFVLSQVLVCGMGLTLYALFQMLPIEETEKIYWMLGAGLALFWVPLFLILWGTSDRLWMKALKNYK